ncbi:hypothetical protein F6X40_09515 [Paraburkholderia sp. UCT31]|uniref:hypothetical protein n=1 Tax=Paraburkholderia sp. UCT31 TaxID=2615209 RepID=UPI0016559C24|nr:hypothetical protein [Paraburkholderia sp. UCT31]MBC8737046.1 hypothetical protein [Paraburkholderia sp. UCT31]
MTHEPSELHAGLPNDASTRSLVPGSLYFAQYIGNAADVDVDDKPYPYLAVLEGGVLCLQQTIPDIYDERLVAASGATRHLMDFVRISAECTESDALQWLEAQYEYPNGPGFTQDLTVFARLLGVYAPGAAPYVRNELMHRACELLPIFEGAFGSAQPQEA